MPNPTVAIENNTGLVDFGECPKHKDKRLIRKNHANGKFQCEVDRHEVAKPRKGTG